MWLGLKYSALRTLRPQYVGVNTQKGSTFVINSTPGSESSAGELESPRNVDKNSGTTTRVHSVVRFRGAFQ